MGIVNLTKGANTQVSKNGIVEVIVEWENSPCDLDISCFMVDSSGKVPSDAYMIFYNQDEDPEKSIKFSPIDKTSVKFTINLDKIGDKIEKCVFSATLDGEGKFGDVAGCKMILKANDNEIIYVVDGVDEETALVVTELYKHSSGFKVRGIGRGFNGGLKPLAEAHGVEVADEEVEVEEVVKPEIKEEKNEPKVEKKKVNLTKIDELKEKVIISLEKKKIHDVKARVAVVLDASGSMGGLFRKGTVQRAFEKVLAVASCMDDDGELDVWFFADKSWRAPSVREGDFEGYVKRTYAAPGQKKPKIGYGNNEPDVMKDIIKKYTKEEKRDDIPTYIVFFSDGGIYLDKEISKILTEASKKNLFWQFVGLGRANFGILQKLDDLPGRFIDNADFFSLKDLDKVSDEELYDRLFNEFPGWLAEARKKGILK